MRSKFLISQWIRRPGRLPLAILLGVLVIAAVYLSLGSGSAASTGPSIDVPNLTLASLDGTKISLSQYKGSVVLINFWATWCPPCQKEIPALEAAYQAYKDQGFVILGVDVGENRQVVASYAESIGMTYPILLDENDRWMGRFGGMGLPMSVVIDRDGQLGETHLGELTEAELDALLATYLAAP